MCKCKLILNEMCTKTEKPYGCNKKRVRVAFSPIKKF